MTGGNMSNFVNLHVHSNYSFLDGMSRVEDIVLRVKELGQSAVALSDHGVMTGIIPFYQTCKKYGVKPLLGMEGYFTRSLELKGKHSEVNSHLLMIATSNVGYQNLMKLSTLGHEQSYHRPRVCIENLDKHREGIFITTTCLASPFRKAWMFEPEIANPWLEAVEQLFEIFEGNIACETQTYEAQEQYEYNTKVRIEADRRKVPIIVTSDCHYTRKTDYDAHDVMLAMQSRKSFDDPDRMRHKCNTLYLHHEKELLDLKFSQEEISNTKAIADMCDVDLDFSVKFPRQDNSIDRLTKQCFEALKKKKLDKNNEYLERLTYELAVIQSTGFPDYFIVLADIVNEARRRGIPTGPGRGSAGGSLVCQLVGITDVDPIKHNLLFERFLNADRVALPDIDVDFGDQRRSEVVEYIIKKFGQKSTAQICTVHKLGVRQAVKDILRTFKIDFGLSNSITGLIPWEAESFEEALSTTPNLRELWAQTNLDKRIVEYIDMFHGTPRQPGTHAAAMVIAPGDITDYIPLMKVKDEMVTGYDMYAIETVGLVKFDILGLKALTVIDNTIKAIVDNYEFEDIAIRERMSALDDVDVFKMIADGKTLGCFQIETSGITGLCRKMQVKCFEDIVHVVSLYRPAVLDTPMLQDYLDGRENPAKIRYVHPDLKEVLKETYGQMIFQEQLMKMSMKIAGFTASQADTLRKGVAKKKPEILAELKGDFISGARQQGYSVAEGERMFKLIEAAGNYSFNYSHAVSYSIISYQMAWLKHYYPVHFITQLLNCEDEDQKAQEYFSEARRLGIDILPIDINQSTYNHFSIGNSIRVGMRIIKGVGEQAANTVVLNRKHGAFKSIEDFLLKFNATKVNAGALKALISVGAFDGLDYNRRQLLEEGKSKLKISECVDKIKKSKQMEMNHKGQTTLFDMATITKVTLDLDPDLREFSDAEMRALELENFGFYLQNPLFEMEEQIRKKSLTTIEDVKRHKNDTIVLIGIVETPKVFKYTPKRTMLPEHGCRWTLKTLDDKISCVSFGSHYQKAWSLLTEGTVVAVSGKFNEYNGEVGVIVSTVKPGKVIKN